MTKTEFKKQYSAYRGKLRDSLTFSSYIQSLDCNSLYKGLYVRNSYPVSPRVWALKVRKNLMFNV